jgi:hypothetical protein
MDLLSQRYASPFLILDEFIRLHQLHDFTLEIFGIIAEEKTHEARWQYYLHKVFDISFEEFVRRCEQPQNQDSGMTHEEIGNVINQSKLMLEGFNPSL